MVVISTRGRKIYHRKGCIYVKHMNPEFKKEYAKPELREKGYCACKYYNSMRFKYFSEKPIIDRFCEYNNLIYRFDEDVIWVQSEAALDGTIRITLIRQKQQSCFSAFLTRDGSGQSPVLN